MATQETNEPKPVGTKAGKRYKCPKCGTEVLVTRAGQSTLRCCGEAMQEK